MAAAGLGLTAGRHLFVNLNDDHLQAVARANRSGPDAGLKAQMAEYRQQSADDLTPLFCLALMEKRPVILSRPGNAWIPCWRPGDRIPKP